MTLVIDPKVALLKGVDPVQFCVFEKERSAKAQSHIRQTQATVRLQPDCGPFLNGSASPDCRTVHPGLSEVMVCH